MKFIEKNHGHWQLKGLLKDILIDCRAKESTRYAINGIYVGENTLASTDGQRLVELKFEHKIPKGTYFCTADGFLLDFLDGNFPKYEYIIPDKSKQKKIVKASVDVGTHIIGLILGELCHAGCITQLSLYEEPAKILSKVICGKCSVYVNENAPEEHPFVIEAETTIGDLRYIQTPISVTNEARNE